ncbi:hypothetical protein KX928_03975 [Roseobacter sp. YSTF-M11]|uniref:Uncharacterized protein n=1 Tax=Roseobacter insulae TaxID=2859783 RepID=A0A9X1FSF3_9RHOB|nr:hypothetical protein [Roseobacter insulae]MBW4706941.1 hypothetical protein [Roseobacter insulae]
MRHASVPISFQTIQVVSDLRSVAATGFGALADKIGAAHKPALRRIIFEQRCELSSRDAKEIHADLLLAAALPDKGLDPFMTATALLLADRLQNGAGHDDLFWNWDAFQDHYRKGPSPVRAALMNGFRWAHTTRRVNLDQLPEARDLLTYDGDDLIRILKVIARSMPSETRDLVCTAGPAETRDVHRTALENCLKGSCILSEYGGWFPGEVVELVSLDPEHAGHAGCTALVLLEALVTNDAKGRMAFRWEEQADRYLRMKSDVRTAILAGVRHLYEMSPEWRPYASWTPDQILQKAVVVPFAKP